MNIISAVTDDAEKVFQEAIEQVWFLCLVLYSNKRIGYSYNTVSSQNLNVQFAIVLFLIQAETFKKFWETFVENLNYNFRVYICS